jgi:ketosteroid isomerase-like protein
MTITNAMTVSQLAADVHTFFQRYNEAFASIDGQAIAALYCIPTVTMRGDGSIHCFQSQEEAARFFQGVADSYQKDGYGGGTFSDIQVTEIGGRSVLATMDWEMLRYDGSLIRKWRQSYNLVLAASGWKILVSTFHVPAAAAA